MEDNESIYDLPSDEDESTFYTVVPSDDLQVQLLSQLNEHISTQNTETLQPSQDNNINYLIYDNNVLNDNNVNSDKIIMNNSIDENSKNATSIVHVEPDIIEEFIPVSFNQNKSYNYISNSHIIASSILTSTQEISNISLKPNYLKTTPVSTKLATEFLKSSPLTNSTTINNLKNLPSSVIEGTPDLTFNASPQFIPKNNNVTNINNPPINVLAPSLSKINWNQSFSDSAKLSVLPSPNELLSDLSSSKILNIEPNPSCSLTDIFIPSSILSIHKVNQNEITESAIKCSLSDAPIPSSILSASKGIQKVLSSSPNLSIKFKQEMESQCFKSNEETFCSTLDSQVAENEFTYSPTQDPIGFSVISPDCYLESIPKHLHESENKSQLLNDIISSSLVSFSVVTVDVNKLSFSDIQVHFDVPEKEIIDKSIVNKILLNNPASIIGILPCNNKPELGKGAPIIIQSFDLEETIPEFSPIDLCDKSPTIAPSIVIDKFTIVPNNLTALNLNFEEGVILSKQPLPDTIPETLIDPFLDPDPTQLTQHEQFRIDSNVVQIPISPQYFNPTITPKSNKKSKITTPISNRSPLSKINNLNEKNVKTQLASKILNSLPKPQFVVKLSNSEIPCIIKSNEKKIQSNKRRRIIDDSDNESDKNKKSGSLNLKNDFNNSIENNSATNSSVKAPIDNMDLDIIDSLNSKYSKIQEIKTLLTPVKANLQSSVKKSKPNPNLTPILKTPIIANNLNAKSNKTKQLQVRIASNSIDLNKSVATILSPIPPAIKIKTLNEVDKTAIFSGYYFFLTGFKGKKNSSNTPIKSETKNTPSKSIVTPKIKIVHTPARTSDRNIVTPSTNSKIKSSPITSITKKRLTRSITDKIAELDEPISEPDLIVIIESLGGVIVAHLSDIIDSMNVVVIAERPLTTLKYLYSLARGLPAIDKTWVKSCVDNKSIINAANFKIDSGSCYQRGKIHIFKDRSLAMRQGLVALPLEQRVLFNTRIGVYSFDISQLNDAIRLVKETGAITFEVTDKCECSELFDYLIVFCNDEPSVAMKNKIMKVWNNYRPKCIVTKYWLYDCLILQRKVEDFEFEGYRFSVF